MTSSGRQERSVLLSLDCEIDGQPCKMDSDRLALYRRLLISHVARACSRVIAGAASCGQHGGRMGPR